MLDGLTRFVHRLAIPLGVAAALVSASCVTEIAATPCGVDPSTGTEIFCPAGHSCLPTQDGFTCVLDTCGNGSLDVGEECDEGAQNSASPNAPCRPDCSLPSCGDGIVDDAPTAPNQPAEICDDGDQDNSDSCPDGANGTCVPATCGDSFVWDTDGGSEGCDDGNGSNADGCPDGIGGICQPATCGDGFVWSGNEGCDCGADAASLRDPALCPLGPNDDLTQDRCRTDCTPARCGDGFVDSAEECDDGNVAASDGCGPTCKIEGCGNGVLDPGEQCDDGNGVLNDICPDGLLGTCNTAYCGDGFVYNTGGGTEECDEGTNNSDSVPNACRPISCRNAYCGDGVVDDGEQCDDGNQTNGDGCSDACINEACGNGAVDPGEDCDTAGDSATCDADCSFVVCGDSYTNAAAGEDCDDGGVDTATCDSDCSTVHCGDGHQNAAAGELCDTGGESATCDFDCTPALCGDGYANAAANEQCDPGAVGVDTAICDSDCTNVVCGDGHINIVAGETCEAGGIDTATCDSDCTAAVCGDGHANAVAGEACDTAGDSVTCDANCTTAFCGDSYTNAAAGETCDDGGDSVTCDADCTAAMCGDSYHNAAAGEACDTGGDTASCDFDCTTAVCGDSYPNAAAGEACDTGGDSITCDANCTTAVCGDSYTNAAAGETCDDGGDTPTCDADCTLPICGDSYHNAAAGEDCDGGGVDTPTCDFDCTTATCGDSYTNAAAGETCDDGGVDTATCDFDCTAATCGDGYINAAAGETCEGADLGGQLCSDVPSGFGYNFDYGTLSCGGTCVLDSSACYSGNTCDTAAVITGSTSFSHTTTGLSHDYNGNGCGELGGNTNGYDRAYQIDLAAGEYFVAWLTPGAFRADLYMSVGDCTLATCPEGWRRNDDDNGRETLHYAVSAATTVYLFVDSRDAGNNGPYDLDITIGAWSTPTSAGDVIVSEVMHNPEDVSDSDGEWFEIRNMTGSDLNLQTMDVDGEGGETFTIDHPLIIYANGYLVIARNGDWLSNGLVNNVSWVASGFDLDTFSNDTITLIYGATTLDDLDWTPLYPGDPDGLGHGRSMELCTNPADATANDDINNWYNAPTSVNWDAGNDDHGTPGTPNANGNTCL